MKLRYTQLGSRILLNALEIGTVASRANAAIVLHLKYVFLLKRLLEQWQNGIVGYFREYLLEKKKRLKNQKKCTLSHHHLVASI